MEEQVKEYDENNNLIYYKDALGFENWYKYDENNRIIYYKYSKNTYNNEYWYKWENNKQIEITHQEFKQIERTKLYLNNKKINKFEIIDI